MFPLQVDHHFVALVEVEGSLWELDGRRKGGPKLVGSIFMYITWAKFFDP